jgi:hypothetical protein
MGGPFIRTPCSSEEHNMPYDMKPLSCDPAALHGLSEKLIVSHAAAEAAYTRAGV